MTRTTRQLLTSAAALAMAITLPAAALAQRGGKPPKPPTSIPGTTDFRCDIADIDLCADGLVGNGTSYPGTGVSETGAGTHLTTGGGELWLGKSTITVDFRGQGPTVCGGAGQPACRWDWATDNRATVMLTEIQSNVVSGLNGEPVDGGLLSIPEGASGFSRLKITIANADGNTFALNFDSEDGSTTAKVTRTAACTWVFTDDYTGDGPTADDARAFLKSGVRRNRIDEGLFSLPFEMTFTAPDCVAGS